jgi:N-acetylneuraminic acid mutarotase
MKAFRGAAVIALVATSFGNASIGWTRNLGIEERIRAQEAIERVYYSHQIGATAPFEEAVSRVVLERKVKAYLGASAALETVWKTPVTTEMLHRELERMAAQTRMPERLRELYAALGDDPLLIQECLVRPALVDRLARNFFAYDANLHAAERQEAESLRENLAGGWLDPGADHPRRTVVDVVRREAGWQGPGIGKDPSERGKVDPFRLELQPDAFDRYRARLPVRVGEIGSVQEERDAFVIRVIVNEAGTAIKVATFAVPKLSWDRWWSSVAGRFEEDSADVDASASDSLPFPEPSQTGGTEAPCLPDDTWDNGSQASPTPRASHTMVWTGSVMIVWGGSPADSSYLGTGGRYDPATDTWTFVSATNAPSPRAGHTAIWTGSRMIVWGGITGYSPSYLGTGGRYDPATDTWTSVSATNAPSPRGEHTAVWTGSRMIVWGGRDGTYSYFGSGGRYDPATDTWTLTTTANAPSPRSRHTAVWTGNRMVVWGGLDGLILNTGGRYDPATDSWTPTSLSGAPSERAGHIAVWTGSRMVVWGGFGQPFLLTTGGRYDPATDTWTATSTSGAPSGRHLPTAVWTGTQMLVWGGRSEEYWDYLNDGSRYDPTNNTWASIGTGNAPSARSQHGAVWTGNLMVVWGGLNANGAVLSRLDTGGRYDPATNSWTPTSTFQTAPPRSGHTAVWTGGRVVVWGGQNSNGYPADGGRYDPALDTWTPTTLINAPPGRRGHAAVWTGGAMVVWGGQSENESVVLADGGRYNPTTDLWTPVSLIGAPSARASHTAVWTGTEMIVWGGYDIQCEVILCCTEQCGSCVSCDALSLSTGGRYNPSSDTWAPTSGSSAPAARYLHTAVWTGNRMIVWGGGDASGGRYDPGTDTWSPTSMINAPSARSQHTAVWTGSRMVVWGGSSLGDGGRYDPASDTWSPTSATNAPSARSQHTAVWTGSRMVVWGGSDGTSLGDGGRYDPASDTWGPVSMTNVPPPRVGHASVWTGSFMFVWGGLDGSGSPLDNGGRYALGQAGDNDGDGFSECQGDCNDGSAGIHPGSAELCNGLDDDCDGVVDEGSPAGGAVCTVPGHFGPCAFGLTSCAAGALTCVPTVFPSPEICDGIDNDCNAVVDDHAQTPSGIPSVSMAIVFGTTVMGWEPVPDATGYDVMKGDLGVLRGTNGNFSSSMQGCSANNLADTILVLSGAPAPGAGFFYLVRSTNCGGGGTYDSGSPTQVSSRDAEIAASQHCP